MATSIVLTVATARYFEAHPRHAAFARALTQTMDRALEAGEIDSLDALQARVTAMVPWGGLLPAERAAVQDLIRLVFLEIEASAGVGRMELIDGMAVGRIQRLLRAIEVAAASALPMQLRAP